MTRVRAIAMAQIDSEKQGHSDCHWAYHTVPRTHRCRSWDSRRRDATHQPSRSACLRAMQCTRPVKSHDFSTDSESQSAEQGPSGRGKSSSRYPSTTSNFGPYIEAESVIDRTAHERQYRDRRRYRERVREDYGTRGKDSARTDRAKPTSHGTAQRERTAL